MKKILEQFEEVPFNYSKKFLYVFLPSRERKLYEPDVWIDNIRRKVDLRVFTEVVDRQKPPSHGNPMETTTPR